MLKPGGFILDNLYFVTLLQIDSSAMYFGILYYAKDPEEYT